MPVRKHAAADSGFAAASRIGAAAKRNQSGRWGVDEEVSEKSLRNGANDDLGVPAKPLLGTPGSLAFEWMQRRWRVEATGGIFACSRTAKWKSRLIPQTGYCPYRERELEYLRISPYCTSALNCTS